MQEILNGLNDKQYEAVVNTEGPVLVIAGAGSGKTKVLTHKIAYLIQEKNVFPWSILAITFTNKAASEMKERISNLVGEDAKDIWMGTFHSICVRILRKHIDKIGYDSSFIIFDTSDQKTLVKKQAPLCAGLKTYLQSDLCQRSMDSAMTFFATSTPANSLTSVVPGFFKSL